MKTETSERAGITTSEAAAILTALKPRFLQGLSSAELEPILAAATRKRFAANTVMTREGDPAEHLFMMLDGFARFYTMSPQGRKVIVMWVRPGELTGGTAFLSEPRHYALSAEAMQKSSALMWNRTAIRSLAVKSPRLMENALLLAHDYLLNYRMVHVAAICQSAPQRLAQVLGYLAKDIGQKVTGGVELRIRNEELAHEANVTIFTVSRLLGEWQRKGLLTKGRGKMVLRRPEALILLEA